MKIEIFCEAECEPSLLALLRQVIACAVKTETGRDDFELSLTVTDDAAIRTLNRTYRGLDRATDVLSFPLLDLAGQNAAEADFSAPELLDPETGLIPLGDIVISWEHAQRQAEEYGHSLEREACYLCVHSVLHLLGYDHIDPDGQARMRRREEEILRTFDLSRET